MKKLFVAALLLVGITSFAQEKATPLTGNTQKITIEQRNEAKLKALTADLNLDEVQQKQMATIIAEQSAQRQANAKERNAVPGTRATPEALQKRVTQNEEIKAATKEKVRKVLTADQFAKWEQLTAEKKEKMQQRKIEKTDLKAPDAKK